MNMKLIFALLSMAYLLILSGCDNKESFKDIKEFMAKLEGSKTQSSPPNNVVPNIKAVTYQKESSRTPFEETALLKKTDTSNHQPLNAYAVNLLRLLGTVVEGDQTRAYILTPDNKVYQVTIGDSIGDHDGRIVKITQSKVEIIEKPTDDAKQSGQRIVTLQLKDEG